jgi:hypothetical protein
MRNTQKLNIFLAILLITKSLVDAVNIFKFTGSQCISYDQKMLDFNFCGFSKTSFAVGGNLKRPLGKPFFVSFQDFIAST